MGITTIKIKCPPIQNPSQSFKIKHPPIIMKKVKIIFMGFLPVILMGVYRCNLNGCIPLEPL